MGITMLLLQARLPDDPMRDHEHRCFVMATGLDSSDVVCHDLCQGPPSREKLLQHDSLTVGGSGDFYVSKGDLPHFDAFLDFLREVVEIGHPTFASCFGYQCLARALGAEIIHDPANTEVGTFDMHLTADGRSDPLFGAFPDTFRAQLGHKDRATQSAPGTVNLASSRRSPFQALRIPNKPIWATQFHPELSRDLNLDRFRQYHHSYGAADPDDLTAATAHFHESPEASELLPRFLELVFG